MMPKIEKMLETIHNIILESFVTHGKISISTENGEIHITGRSDRGSYIELPNKFKLPFRIDMTAKMDSAALMLYIGDGYINLNTGGMDNRRMMSIIGGETKPNLHKFDHRVPLNEYFDVTVIYGLKAMQLNINGEERYFNKKDSYMKSPSINENFPDGFGLKIACLKRTEITIKSLTISEYTGEPEFPELPKKDFLYAPTLTKTDKPTVEDCIKDLSPELKTCLLDMDKHLRALKLQRKIEGGYPESKITYFIPKVCTYQIKISHHLMTHRTTAMLGFYMNNAEERSDEFNVKFLNRLEEISPELAENIFNRMNEFHCRSCQGEYLCRGNHSCNHYNLTEYKGCKKNNCQHIVQFKMIPPDFDDVKKVIDVIIDLSKEWKE
ncbi:MAG: hypothetical protein FWH14_00270 [Oscillospiraceae bacterium]|nr:hypothetical protein [Oscillospiraceae bacterium]